jgi:hypothetical protein
MSVLQLERLVTHEWEADRHLYRGSMPDIVNEVGGSFSVRQAPLSSSATPDPRLGATRFARGRVLPG